jgi:hypothetical protein
MARQVVRGWHRAKLPSPPLENDDASHGDGRLKEAPWLTAEFWVGEFGAVGALVGRFEVTKDWKISLRIPVSRTYCNPTHTRKIILVTRINVIGRPGAPRSLFC